MTSTGTPRSVRPDKVTLIAVWFGINAAILLFLVAVLLFVFPGLVLPDTADDPDRGLLVTARGFGYEIWNRTGTRHHVDEAVACGVRRAGLKLVGAHVHDGRRAVAGVRCVGVVHEPQLAVEIGRDADGYGVVAGRVNAGRAAEQPQVVIGGSHHVVGAVGVDEQRVGVDVVRAESEPASLNIGERHS